MTIKVETVILWQPFEPIPRLSSHQMTFFGRIVISWLDIFSFLHFPDGYLDIFPRPLFQMIITG